jgi:hypothetical protein
MARGGDVGTWLIIRLQGAPALPEPLPERHKRTARSPSTQLRVWRSLGASAGVLGLEGAAGYLHPALGAARSLNGMRAASPRDPGRRGAPEPPGLHASTEDHPESHGHT